MGAATRLPTFVKFESAIKIKPPLCPTFNNIPIHSWEASCSRANPSTELSNISESNAQPLTTESIHGLTEAHPSETTEYHFRRTFRLTLPVLVLRPSQPSARLAIPRIGSITYSSLHVNWLEARGDGGNLTRWESFLKKGRYSIRVSLLGAFCSRVAFLAFSVQSPKGTQDFLSSPDGVYFQTDLYHHSFRLPYPAFRVIYYMLDSRCGKVSFDLTVRIEHNRC